jgi:hypothetical protein
MQMENEDAFRRNRHRLNFNRFDAATLLERIVKVRPGVGAGLPPPQGQPAGNIPALQVGQCPAEFPQTIGMANDLSLRDIHRMSVAYADDFGIVQADLLSTRREKFVSFIQGGA